MNHPETMEAANDNGPEGILEIPGFEAELIASGSALARVFEGNPPTEEKMRELLKKFTPDKGPREE
jgi:hypothetical protein